MQEGILKKKILIILGIILVLVGIFFATKPYRTSLAATYLSLGDKLMENQEYPEAKTQYLKARLLLPGNFGVTFKVAETYEKLGNYQLSYSYYNKARKILPNDPKTYLAMANINWRNNNLDKAVEILNKGLDKISNNNDRQLLQINLGKIYLIKKDSAKAKTAFSDTGSNYWLGIYFAYLGDYQSAKNYFRKETTDNAKLFNQATVKIINTKSEPTQKAILAQMLNQTGEARLALPILKDLVQKNPEYRDAWIFLGYSNLELGNSSEALAALETAQKLDPIYPLTYELLAKLYQNKGNEAKAKEYLDRANALK